jgi:hypothetical protein
MLDGLAQKTPLLQRRIGALPERLDSFDQLFGIFAVHRDAADTA